MEKRIPKTGIRSGDFFVITAVLAAALPLLAAPLLFSAVPGDFVQIRTENDAQTYPLHTDREISVRSKGYSLTVTVENGAVRVSGTDCPSGVCAATGAISVPGQSIVCAPAEVLITILRDGGAEDDETPDVILP